MERVLGALYSAGVIAMFSTVPYLLLEKRIERKPLRIVAAIAITIPATAILIALYYLLLFLLAAIF